MKKVLAIILALVMIFAIVACGNGDSNTSGGGGGSSEPPAGGGASSSSKAFPNCNPDGTVNLNTIAHYDPDYDYTQNERYKVCYIAQDGGPLYADSAKAYEHWAPLMNMEWMGFISANGDTDLFLQQLQNQIDQGVKAFIVDPDATIMQTVQGVLNRHPDVRWMTQMAPPRDGAEGPGIPLGGNLVTSYVGHDHYDAGVHQTERLIEWKNDNFPNVPWNEIGFLAMSFSVSPPLMLRVFGAEDVWMKETGSTANFFVADTVSTGLNMQGAMDAAAPIISTNGQYKHWLVMGLIDDLAQGAATILEQQGLTDTSCVVTFGGSGFISQMDGGQHDAFRYALFTAQYLYGEPIIGAVYAYLNGWATSNSIWPLWVRDGDHGADGNTFSQYRLPVVWLDKDNYQHYLAWCDMYANGTRYGYSQAGIARDAYAPFLDEVPPGFSGTGQFPGK